MITKPALANVVDPDYQGWEKEPTSDFQWVIDTLAGIWDKAAQQLAQAYSNAEEKHGQGNFEVKFRSKK